MAMMRFDKDTIRRLMTNLVVCRQRLAFYSEADFQFTLAEEIKEQFKENAKIYLEHPLASDGKARFDIIVDIENHVFPIELKYKTRKLKVPKHGIIPPFEFSGKQSNAALFSRAQLLLDVQRIEELRSISGFEKGYALWLTNDHKFWNWDWKNRKEKPLGTQFDVSHGETKKGSLQWEVGQSKAAERGESVFLKDSYTIEWEEYSQVPDEPYGILKYAIVEVKGATGK